MSQQLLCEFFKSKKGALKLYINGYTYDKNRVKDNRFYWLCETRYDKIYKCNSSVITTVNENNSETHVVIKNPGPHNHEANPMRKKLADFCDTIKKEASVGKKACQVLQDNLASTSSEVREYLPTKSALKQIIYRTKKKSDLPSEPSDINFQIDEKYVKLLGNNFIIKDHIYDENKRIILLSSFKMMNLLSTARYWIMDGTFKVVPSIFHQLYTIHGNINDENKTFPLLFCLSSNKDKRSYQLMFELIMEYGTENNLDMTPKVCILDFEKAAILSLRANFENVLLHGCLFHLGQIIYRKIQSSGLVNKYSTNQEFNIEMKCLLALSYLSPDNIPIYFNEILSDLQDEDSKTIYDWFEANYVSGTVTSQPKYNPEFWSCYVVNSKNIPRTQNSAESWHHHINQIINKKTPGFYHLVSELIKETIINDTEIEKLLNGEPPEKKKKKYIVKEKRIERILQKKESLSKKNFIKEIAKNLKL